MLDVGCGDGQLLTLLEATRRVDGRGIEISQRGVNECVARGLSVIQGDADTDLVDYPDDAFDYVILSQTLQATAPAARRRRADAAHRAEGDRLLPEFRPLADPRRRSACSGRMPVTSDLPYSWYDTPNIHFCTIRDFVALCDEIDAEIEKAHRPQRRGGSQIGLNAPWWFWNLFGQQAVFLLQR